MEGVCSGLFRHKTSTAEKVGGRAVDATIVGIIVFTCTFGGVLLGMWLRAALPEHWLDAESRDTVKVGVGLIATMTALVLGLVTPPPPRIPLMLWTQP
jgi:hypothetical protein